ncbi:MAG: hypothetical protein KatS3mg124_0705 [Porticoccaceae bacterium]|nr:MAG: hypothetical protein KatS3mg124_0705 [Porticoccaceae bacterium]
MVDPLSLQAAILRGELPSELFALGGERLDAFLAAADAEGVSALLRHRLAAAGVLETLPAALVEGLQGAALALAARDLARRRENARLFARLRRSGLDFLLLKGEALAHTLYPAPHLRPRLDTDLLFPDRSAAQAAVAALLRLGYAATPAPEGRFGPLQWECSRDLGGGLIHWVDLHASLCNNLWLGCRFPFGELIHHSQPLAYEGVAVRVPTPPLALLHGCLHRLANLRAGTADRLIWRYDLWRLAEAMDEGEWRTFLTLAAHKGVAGFCAEALARMLEFFPSSAAERALPHLAEAGRREWRPPGLDRSWGHYLADLKSLPELSARLAYLRELAFPPAAYMRARYGIRHGWLLPWSYLRRLGRVLGK